MNQSPNRKILAGVYCHLLQPAIELHEPISRYSWENPLLDFVPDDSMYRLHKSQSFFSCLSPLCIVNINSTIQVVVSAQ